MTQIIQNARRSESREENHKQMRLMECSFQSRPYPATLLSDPVDHMIPDVVYGPVDYSSDDFWNFGDKGLEI